MNGVHDLGGMDGFRLPERDRDGPILKEEWERQIWGLVWALRIPGSSSEVRASDVRTAIENMPPELYLGMPYYARFLYWTEQSVLRSGLATEAELRNPDGPITMPNIPNFQPPGPEDVVAGFSQDSSSELDADVPALFSVGDAVIVKNEHPVGHTRAPRYVRGRRGIIHRDHGVHQFEDATPPGVDRGPQHLYSVMFTGPELWGSRGNPRDRIYVELWDDHLQPAV